MRKRYVGPAEPSPSEKYAEHVARIKLAAWQVNSPAYIAGERHYAQVGYRENPLSGEHAGESIPELTVRYGIILEDPEQAELFEAGFFDAMERDA